MKSLSLFGGLLASLALVVTAAAPVSAETETDFDLQAHRGGLALVVESTLPAFANALELGVDTLELDVQITQDGEAVVTHDRQVSGKKCLDTEPATPDDPEFPYVGKYVNTLSLAQITTLDCGSQTLPEFPDQRAHPGEHMPLLSEVFDLVKSYQADQVRFNIETKVEAAAPDETAPAEEFVKAVTREITAADVSDRVSIQSFDWGTLMLMHRAAPELPLNALSNVDFLEIGKPGASPWLGGIDIDDFDGDPIAAIDSFGASAYSPVHGFPQDGGVGSPDYEPYVTAELVDHAHAKGIDVVSWTVDDKATMHKLIDDGVDGIITNHPDRLREVMAERGMSLPIPYDPPAGSA